MVASIFASQQPAFRVTYDPDAVALFARMTVQPNDARKAAINKAIVDLKSQNIWGKLDTLYFMAAHEAQAANLNWKGPAFTATPVNSPAFTVDRGYTGDGTSAYIETGYALEDQPGSVPTSQSLSAYYNGGTPTSGRYRAGQFRGSVGLTFISDNNLVRVVQGSSTAAGFSLAAKFVGASRVDTSSTLYCYDSVAGSAASAVDAFATTGTTTVLLGVKTGLSTVAGFSPARIAYAAQGRGLTNPEQVFLNSVVTAYLTSMGAQ